MDISSKVVKNSLSNFSKLLLNTPLLSVVIPSDLKPPTKTVISGAVNPSKCDLSNNISSGLTP